MRYAAGAAGALLVLAIGKVIAGRRAPKAPAGPAAAAAVAASGGLKRVLVAVDGSEVAARAVQQVLGMRRDLASPETLELHLVHVQRPVSGDVSSFVASKTLEEYYQEQSDAALAPAKKQLEDAGQAYQAHARVGSPGETIAKEAVDQGCDLIVMGTRGGGMSSALLGSVAQDTIAQSPVPVMLVR
jgi:nucleotide-binding universal stress UspA family protein